ETDVKVSGRIDDFTAPNVNLLVSSTGINLDKLLPPPPEPSKEETAQKPGAGSETSGEAAQNEPGPNVDEALAPLRENELLKKLRVSLGVDIKKFQGFKIIAQNFVLKA